MDHKFREVFLQALVMKLLLEYYSYLKYHLAGKYWQTERTRKHQRA